MPAPATAALLRSVPASQALRVGGLVPFTTTDYPGRLAAVVFCQGCPWRCGYCHNPHLLASEADSHVPAWPEVVAFLAARRGLLEAVVFSGGEPTAQDAILDAIAKVRGMGFGIALHTAGIYPRRLERVLPQVDWIGLDIKASARAYPAVTGVARAAAPAFESLARVCASGVDYEVRTTVHPHLLPLQELEALAEVLAEHGVQNWVLQPFRPIGCASPALNAAAPRGTILHPAWIERLRGWVPGVAVRA